MTREEIAYVAGLYEGEGNVCRRKDYRNVILSIRMTDREPLEKVLEYTTIGSVTGPHKSTGPTKGREYTPIYSYKVYGSNVQAFIAMVWSHLSPRRKAQARAALVGANWKSARKGTRR